MWLDIITLIGGLALLVLGGNLVTDGSASIARRLHMPGFLVGITVVALGSATPDLVVGVVSTIHNKTELAIGDAVGATIFDLLLVVGVIALIKPIKANRATLTIDFPMAMFATLILFFLADDRLIDGATSDLLLRSDGLVMLAVLGMFMAYTVMASRMPATSMPDRVQQHSDAGAVAKEMNAWLAVAFIVGGLVALVAGGQWFVDGASDIAKRAGMSEALVGLTVVAIGSSLPDLATSAIAAVKNQPGIALGNIIGGSIFNILLVLGASSLIRPLQGSTISQVDFLVLVGSAALVWLFAATGKQGSALGRVKGAVLVLCYLAYMAYLIVRG